MVDGESRKVGSSKEGLSNKAKVQIVRKPWDAPQPVLNLSKDFAAFAKRGDFDIQNVLLFDFPPAQIVIKLTPEQWRWAHELRLPKLKTQDAPWQNCFPSKITPRSSH